MTEPGTAPRMAACERQPVNFNDKLALIHDHWRQRVVAEMNDYQFKLVKILGDFVWHDHADTDETFIVLSGTLRIDFRDGAVTLRELVRQALRMRPDRLVVGEFRGAEMVELLVALNTGHEGSAATLHANSAADVPARFAALGALAGLPAAAVTSLVASAIDLVVHLHRGRDGRRVVAEIGLLDRGGDELSVSSVWTHADGRGPAWARADHLIGSR